MTHSHSSPIKVTLMLITVVVLWSSAFVGIRAGLHGYSPGALALFRYGVASIGMMVLFFFLKKKTPLAWRDVPNIFLLGAIGFGLYNVALNYGEISVTAGITSFIISQMPIAITLLAITFLGERLSGLAWFGIVVSMVGVILIAFSHRTEHNQWDIGILYLLLATLSAGVYAVGYKKLLSKYNPVELTAYGIWSGTLVILFYAPALWREMSTASLEATLAVVYLGIFPAVVGYVGWSYVLRHIHASTAGTALYSLPILTTLMGWLFLGEIPALLSLFGGLIALGGAMIVVRAKKSGGIVKKPNSPSQLA